MITIDSLNKKDNTITKCRRCGIGHSVEGFTTSTGKVRKTCLTCLAKDASDRKALREKKKQVNPFKKGFENNQNIVLTENVDKDKLAWIIKNHEKYDIGKSFVNGKRIDGAGQLTLLTDYYNGFDAHGSTQMGYCQRNGFGRMWIKKKLGLTNISRIIRQTIVKGTMIDIDIVNAHPVLLSSYCKKHGIPCEALLKYCNTREPMLQSLMKDMNVDREEAKRDLICVINGQARKPRLLSKYPQWYQDFYNGMEVIIEAVCKREPYLYSVALKSKTGKATVKNGIKQKPYNVGGTCVNYVMCSLENKALMIMYHHMVEAGVKVSSLMYDGLMVYNTDIDIGKILQTCMASIKRVMEADIKIIVKPMKEALDLSDMKDFKAPSIGLHDFTKAESLFTLGESDYVKIEKVPEDIRYVKDLEWPAGFDTIAIKSSLGSGKTTSICRYIKDNNVKRVLVLSPRQSFASSITHEYNSKIGGEAFVNYMDVKKRRGNLQQHNRLVCSMESLHFLKVSHESIPFDLLVVDECQANLTSHVSCMTNGKNHDDNVYSFSVLMRKSRRKVFADAFLGSKTLDFLTLAEHKTIVYDYQRKMDKREIVEVIGDDLDTLLPHLVDSIDRGETNYVYVSSHKRLEKWASIIRRDFPLKTILTYVSGEGGNIKDVVEEWKGADMVMTTCTITVGLNFDLKGIFNNVYISASAMSQNLVADIFQSHYRVRHIMGKVFFHLSTKVFKKFSTDIDEIKLQMAIKERRLLKESNLFQNSPEEIKELVAMDMFEKHLSIMELRAVFYRFIQECGYDIRVLGTEEPPEIEEVEEEEVLIPTWSEIALISEERHIMLYKKRQSGVKLSTMDGLELSKYRFTSKFARNFAMAEWVKRPVAEDLWMAWCDSARMKTIISSIQYECRINSGETTFAKLVNNQASINTIPALTNNKALMKIPFTNELLRMLGLKSTVDVHTVVKNDDFKALARVINDDYESYAKNHNVGDRRTDKSSVSIKGAKSLIDSSLRASADTHLEYIGARQKKVNGVVITVGEDRDLKIVATKSRGGFDDIGLKAMGEFSRPIEQKRLLVPEHQKAYDPVVRTEVDF